MTFPELLNFVSPKIPLGMGWDQFCLAENESHIFPNVCQIWLRSDGHVEMKGGGTDRQTDRQTDKGTLQLYIVDRMNYYIV